MENEEDASSTANSEIRFITLELMRLAQKTGKSFDEIAAEFIMNTHKLQDMIAATQDGMPSSKTGKKSNAWQK
jgi:hypothetical protein